MLGRMWGNLHPGSLIALGCLMFFYVKFQDCLEVLIKYEMVKDEAIPIATI
jgi:hypothetical protein